MHFHVDSSLPDRTTRQPYWPLDYVSVFTYLTATNPRTPALCIVSLAISNTSILLHFNLRWYAYAMLSLFYEAEGASAVICHCPRPPTATASAASKI